MSGHILHWMLPVKHQMFLIELEGHCNRESCIRVDGVERAHTKSQHNRHPNQSQPIRSQTSWGSSTYNNGNWSNDQQNNGNYRNGGNKLASTDEILEAIDRESLTRATTITGMIRRTHTARFCIPLAEKGLEDTVPGDF
ncbi:hypothetical protein CAEBREN_11681 [Caenorhabditis brenneri]|uniref:Uncharacterized protein n=1 Tax=Caenorhabditis brenneri TaxID=135651 RepID=G0NHZ2_CAEBE|nr:hypothetical protein CAEBREN_11681 [Caenorhabditis brenneri]